MKKATSILLVLLILISATPLTLAASVSDFSDVKSGDWFYSAVKTVTEKGMFNGTSASTFSPLGTMERGMFVTVLGRYGNVTPTVPKENGGIVTKSDVNMRDMPTTQGSKILATLSINTQVEIIEKVAGKDDPSFTWYYVNHNGVSGYIREDLMEPSGGTFTDVPDDAYYSGYVYWAFNTGVAGKTGDSTFSPTRAITREEICSMMYNYAAKRNLEIKATVSAINFTDRASISSSYSAAVSAMQKAGVVTGYTDGSFRPKDSATRSEVAAMLTRFIDCISYKPVIEASYDSAGNYIWGTEVPESPQVNASYFSDACFIGHSIVTGMNTYLGLSNTDFYAFNGANVKNILTQKFPLPSDASSSGTLAEALELKSYGKVYIMLGANESGVGSAHEQNFYSGMNTLIDLVRKSQPDAKIFLISFTPVSQTYSESRADLSRDNIIKYNSVIKRLCKEKGAYYLNVFDLLVNSDGFLPVANTFDGIHINASEYAKIKNYIFSHTRV